MKATFYSSLIFTVGLVLASSLPAAESGSGDASERAEETRLAADETFAGRQTPYDHELLSGASRAATPGTTGWGEGSGCPVSVGPESGCDYDSLQLAINDAEGGDNCGHIAVTSDYSLTMATNITHLVGWDTPPGTPAWLMGGFPDCNDLDPANATTTVLDADQQGRPLAIWHPADESDPLSVLRIENFQLINGQSGFSGGALSISGVPGRLAVELVNVEIRTSQADESGGGIYLQAIADGILDDPDELPPPMLFIDDDSHITLNEAEEKGGGIYCENSHERNTVMLLTGAGLIADNRASDGGGVALSNCVAWMQNGRPLWFLVPTGGIMLNEASSRGGGLFAESGSIAVLVDSMASEMGGDPDSAFLIGGNEAEVGGGVYLTDEDTQGIVIRTRIFGNESTFEGAGIYVNAEASLLLSIPFSDQDLACRPPFSQSGLTFLPPCNVLENNRAGAGGGAAVVRNAGQLQLRNAFITGNESDGGSASAILASNSITAGDDPPARVDIINSVVADHSGGSHVLFAGSGGHIEVRWSSVADNDYSSSLFHAFASSDRQARYEIRSSIVWQDDGENMATRDGAGNATAHADCVIAFEDAGDTDLGPVAFYSVIDPEFVDPDSGNYRLSTTSPAINYCDDLNSPPDYDLDGRLRGLEYPFPTTPAPNSHTDEDAIYDLGAFVAPSDDLFGDRFETD